MKIENAIASLAVKDLPAASAWYEKLFRRPADATPMPEVPNGNSIAAGGFRSTRNPCAPVAAPAPWPPTTSLA